jgi:hypothetical protein
MASAGGGAASASPTEASGSEDVDNMQATKPKTEVVVQVQGNVFNGREQAQLIAEGLNEWFDTNGGILARRA